MNKALDCREAEKRFPQFIDKTLSDEETQQFLTHIRCCPKCRSELDTEFMIVEGVRLLDTDTEDYDLGGTMSEAVRKALQHLRIVRFRTIAAASVDTLVLLSLLGTLLLELRILFWNA